MAAGEPEFAAILGQLLSPDNDVRIAAEKIYNEISLEERTCCLLKTLAAPLSDDIKQLTAVLLRRLLSSSFTDLRAKLPAEAIEQLKQQVLFGLQVQGQSENLRKKMCDMAAELARNLIDDDGNNLWPELLRFLFNCANGQTPPQAKDTALRIFASVPGIFGNQEASYIDMIKQMLHQSLKVEEMLEIRVQATRAVCSFLLNHEKEPAVLKHFSDLLPLMLQVLAEDIKANEDDVLLKCMIEVAESTPKFLRNRLDTIIDMAIKVVRDQDLMDSTRHLALELLVTLAENAPSMVRKFGASFIGQIVQEALQMMTLIEDETNWSQIDEVAETDPSGSDVMAESALDRLSCSLGGKTLLPHITSLLPKMLNNPDWRYRHAALMAISAIGEGCHKQMEPMLPQIVDTVMGYLQDGHARVRYAACNAIGQMAADFAPQFQKRFHERVIAGLLVVMGDQANPRTQAHAGAAIVNFCESCPKDILKRYLEPIMSKLESVLRTKLDELIKTGTKLVLEQAVTSIAAVADAVEELFLPYYDPLMPMLKYIIENAVKDEHKFLRGKTIECVSLIGLAVGPEKFIRDAGEVMDLLLKAQATEELADDDPQTSYMISAWARICKIMGKDFEQYLPLVMPPVLKTASIKPEVGVFDNEDMNEVDEGEDWQFVHLNEMQNFGIKTNGLEEKASACEMLVCYAKYLGEGFANYVEEVVRLMVPLLKFYFHDNVRTAAAESLPYLLEAGKAKGPDFVSAMWNYMFEELLKAIDTEPEQEVLSDLMQSLSKCIETLGVGCLSEQFMTDLIKILDKQLVTHFERADERSNKRKDEDYDELIEENLEDEDIRDVWILSKVADVLHSLFDTYRTDFFPCFDQLLHHIVKLMQPERSWADHQWGLCIFDDVIEYGGPECFKYKDYFLPALINYTQDLRPEVRQAAVYGCGVLGQFSGPAFAQVCAEAIPHLVNIIRAPESRAPENINPTENAISAVTKILKYNSSAINTDEIIAVWLSWLPVWEDKEECPIVYGYLCDLIESNHPTVIGVNGSNVPNLVAIFGEALHQSAFASEDETGRRVVGLIRQIQSNAELFRVCLGNCSEDQRRALEMALTSSAT